MTPKNAAALTEQDMAGVVRLFLAEGAAPTALVFEICRSLGADLQDLPPRDRERLIARLRSKADRLRARPLALLEARMIDALLEGWESRPVPPDAAPEA